jgi:hypothetical protein
MYKTTITPIVINNGSQEETLTDIELLNASKEVDSIFYCNGMAIAVDPKRGWFAKWSPSSKVVSSIKFNEVSLIKVVALSDFIIFVWRYVVVLLCLTCRKSYRYFFPKRRRVQRGAKNNNGRLFQLDTNLRLHLARCIQTRRTGKATQEHSKRCQNAQKVWISVKRY